MSPRFERRPGGPSREGGQTNRGSGASSGGWRGPGRDRDRDGDRSGGGRRDFQRGDFSKGDFPRGNGERREGGRPDGDNRYRGRPSKRFDDKRGSDDRGSRGWGGAPRGGGSRPEGGRPGGGRFGGDRSGGPRSGPGGRGTAGRGERSWGGERRSDGGQRRFEGGQRRFEGGPRRADGEHRRPSQGRFQDRPDRFKEREPGQGRFADRRSSSDERPMARNRFGGASKRNDRFDGSQVAPQGEAAAATPPADDLIWGRHATLAALESGRPIHRIWCTPEMRSAAKFLQLLREAKASGVLVEEVTWARLGQITGGSVHQGIALQTAAADTLDLDTLIDGCSGLGEPPLLLALDGVTDPHNLGAIVRSAEAMGAHGVVLPQRRSAGLTGSAAKVAAGALEHMPVARVVNLNRSLEKLKDSGYRVIGLAAEGDVTLTDVDLDGPLVLVTGSEDQGLSLMTRRHCDQLVRIPLRGITPSLNASVATALCVYEVARRNWMKDIHGQAPSPPIVRPRRVVESESVNATDEAVVDAAPQVPPESDPLEINLEAPASDDAAGIRFDQNVQLSP